MALELKQRHASPVPGSLERARMRERPSGRPVMLQTWRDLVFLHFPVEPQLAQRLLPQGLTIDTYPDVEGREKAWIGLVAFRLANIRPPWGPPLPWLSAFNEVNVRTYAHMEGREPSVWFCSLDGGPWPVRTIARLWYKVPYFKSRVDAIDMASYASRRPSGEGAKISVRPVGVARQAERDSFEWFLFERYQLFSAGNGQTYSARVAHAPYKVQPAEIEFCETTVCTRLGIPHCHSTFAHYCREVRAEFFAPRRVRTA